METQATGLVWRSELEMLLVYLMEKPSGLVRTQWA